MSYEGFVCWNAGQIPRVMNTEALQTENSVFLATHHPVRMYRQSLHRAEVRTKYDQRKFLQDFLAQESFAFVPVLGNAGTGKSHLVRWLNLNLPESDHRRIVLIPKGGTNLRGVIHLILARMEGGQFDEYRARLQRATEELTEATARETLLNNLAVALGPNGGGVRPREMENIARDRREVYEHLEGVLPPLLYDPLLRSHLLREGGIVADLVHHTLGPSEVRERREARRQFSVADLPLNVRDLKDAGAAARQSYGELAGDPELQELAVKWMNLHLDEAVGQLLQLAGNDLTRLMREVRTELALQGVELVLLIEDFAKLQGIERPLLEAILEQPNQPDRQLCVLRTALACTTDYFRGVADTVRDRTTFVVSLDREALGAGAMVTAEDFEQFAGRYLNAIRLRDGELDAWYAGQRESESHTPVPNACERCPYQDICHSSFGAAGGHGLYPFNRTALVEMYGRVQAGGFSPRLLINDVLKHTVQGYGEDIPAGTFPPPALIASFGGSRLSAVMHQQIDTRDPAHAARRKVLVELWGGQQVADLPPGVHTAFRLPPLRIAGPPAPTPPGPVGGPVPAPGSGPPPPPGEIPDEIEKQLIQLDGWGNGAELDQVLAGELRGLVFHAVYNRIDWNAELLVRGAFAGSGKPFKNTSVSFHKQATQVGSARIRLAIPEQGASLTEASLALQGLLLFDHFGHWNFRWGLGGTRYLRIYARLLDDWSRSVVEQIRRGFVEPEGWDPVPAAVELLAIGARLLGEPANEGRLLEHQVAALFALPEGAAEVPRSPLWQNLVKSFRQHREHLMELVISRGAATKGGSTRVQILDSAQLIEPLRTVQTEWLPRQPIPAELPNLREYTVLRKLQEQFREGLDAAIAEERERAIERFTSVASALDWADGVKEVGPVLREAKQRARKEGVYYGPPEDELDRATNTLNRAPLVRWKNSIDIIKPDGADRGTLLSELGQNHEAAAKPAEEFVKLANGFLSSSTRNVQAQVTKLEEAGGRDLEACQLRIGTMFQQLESLVSDLERPAATAGAAGPGVGA